jgi:hypothetical protein
MLVGQTTQVLRHLRLCSQQAQWKSQAQRKSRPGILARRQKKIEQQLTIHLGTNLQPKMVMRYSLPGQTTMQHQPTSQRR